MIICDYKGFLQESSKEILVSDAVSEFVATLSGSTAKTYKSSLKKIAEAKLLEPSMRIDHFARLNHNAILDGIKEYIAGSEASKQVRAASYMSFCHFVNRRVKLETVPTPCKESGKRTFFAIREKVATDALSREEWEKLLNVLKERNIRNWLIAALALQGAKRIGEVLALRTEDILWEKGEMVFTQSKTKGLLKKLSITYPAHVMEALRRYIGRREGKVFEVCYRSVLESFKSAGRKAGIKKKTAPHTLRASAITYLKENGFSADDVMKISGHAHADGVLAYDKSAQAKNVTKLICLV